MQIPAPANFLDIIQNPTLLEKTTITDMFEFIQYLTYVLFLNTHENRTIKPLLDNSLGIELANQHSRLIELGDHAIIWETMYKTF